MNLYLGSPEQSKQNDNSNYNSKNIYMSHEIELQEEKFEQAIKHLSERVQLTDIKEGQDESNLFGE